ncbi:hypothetical protein CXB51_004110 [Gossypium anomalum]|uniref:Retinoblastoma-related protein n=1 Tax=Gossypium anomalum TaxID=47600 RepID=A0A8J6DAN1_9ROSI|nr:hypothetical protein CXB51_004110 [Gossypium anomalum]
MKSSVATSGGTDGDAVEARFNALCKNGLSLDEKACSNATKLFKETKHLLTSNVSAIGSGTLEEAERFWFSFVLYSLKRLSEKVGENMQHESNESGFSLCQILRATKLKYDTVNFVYITVIFVINYRFNDGEFILFLQYRGFFKELPQFLVKAGPVLRNMYGEDWETRLEAKEMQANFVHLSLLSKSYKRAFWELFMTSDANIEKQQNATSSPDYVSECHRFGWLLFLALRVHAFSRFKDLVTCANGFVSILAILIIHVPVSFRNFKINDSPHFGNYLLFHGSQLFRSVLSDKEIAFVILHWSLSFILSGILYWCLDVAFLHSFYLPLMAGIKLRHSSLLTSLTCNHSVKKGDKGVVDLLASLCNMYDASEDDLRKTMEMANKLIEDILKKKPCPAAECKTETLENIDTDSLIYFEGLMEEQSLSSKKDYDDAICNKGDLDERVFVNDEDSLLGLGSLSGGAMNVTGIKRKLDSVASPSKSISSPLSPQRPSASHANGVLGPPNAKMAATPVSTAMTTAKWLRSVICPLPSKPSAELQLFLSSCDKDVTNDVICRVHIILEAIFPRNQECSVTGSLQSVNLMDNIWMEQRRLEALKLYYRVLEAMCTAEAQILHAPNLTSLLTNERFHRCMLACSAELVLATHKTATMLFPTVLDRTGITAFDLSKVIESFIRHEESLPRELRRHLNSLEERLLESMVWDKGSSMYNSLIVAKPALSAEINRLGLLAEPMPPLDAIATHINFSGGAPPVPSLQKHETSTGNAGSSILDMEKPVCQFSCLMQTKWGCQVSHETLHGVEECVVERNAFTSPVKDRLLALSNIKKAPLQSAFASPTRPSPGGGGETCAETGINIFFSKINKLAAVRINGMVERLQLSQQIRESVYSLFKKILNQRTSLFFNRHIDQIILCCFYVVAKVYASYEIILAAISQLRLTFKEIICNYRKQPQCKPQVFQSVFVDRSSARRNGRTGQDNVDIIAFYNEIFVPSIKPLLGELGSAGTTTRTSRVAEANNSNDGTCPGSPKVSPFPSLPDMSPKKVSATHNVYVSPLRTSKMDALISHSSRSYYACVGENKNVYLHHPSVATSGGTDADAVEARFNALCKNGLSLDEKACSNAMKLFKETKHLLTSNVSSIGSGTLSEKVGENTQQESDESGFSFCQILRATKLNIVDFFKELPQFVVKAGPVLRNMYGEDWETRLELYPPQNLNFVVTLYYFPFCEVITSASSCRFDGIKSSYKRAFWELFLTSDAILTSSKMLPVRQIIYQLSSIWMVTVFGTPRARIQSCRLLASLCNMYDASEDDLRKTMETANKLIEDILKKKPCPAAECKTETLENIDTDSLIYFEGLMEEKSLSSSLNILEKDYDDAICNKGDLDERVFVNDEDSLLGLGSFSGGAMNVTGIKRKFDSVASPTKSISSPLSPQRPPASHANGVLGPPNAKMAATPVSAAMTTAKWLRSVICPLPSKPSAEFICPLPSKPSAELQRFLSSCDKDVTNDVICRAHIILEAIFPRNQECSVTGSLQSVNLMDNIWMEQRRLEALKLYYRVLEAMCTAEAQILHAPNLTSLLTNERFHRCMLACSAELVLATHKTATMLFPTVLGELVIESFIRHEESLPRELRRHLNSLEERLLESMVWDKGSSMYNSLIVAKPALSAEINRLGLLAEPMPPWMQLRHITPPVPSLQKHETSTGNAGSSILGQNGDVRTKWGCQVSYETLHGVEECVLVERNAFTSPVKDRLLALNNLKKAPLQSAFASPTRPNPGGGGETCAETGISIFFGKINKLAAVRINGMVERLQLSQQIRESVYSLFQKILNQRASLFFNRHIDQIILCCFYVVAKISQLRLTFKEIICNYRKQPQCKPQVFQSVFVDRSSARRNGRTGQDNVDIIAFYNEIFVPSIKPLLGELGSAGTTTRTSRVAEANNSNDGTCPGSPKVSPFPSLPDMSPKKVSATHNVYVSPLRTSKMDALISHSSRSYYACVGESTRAYQSPSKDLTAINNHLNGKIRGALNFDDVDVGLVSDSMVANSLYLQNGSCASSSGAPLKSEQPES